MEEILLGSTDRTILVFVPDPASTDGSGKTGLAHTVITVSYARVETDNDVTVTDATSSLNALSALTDAHNDWGWKEVSDTLAPGLYRLDVADAVFASGAWYAVVYVMITSSAAAASPKAYRLVAVNALDGVRYGITALPNAAANADAGLPVLSSSGTTLGYTVTTVTTTGTATNVTTVNGLAANVVTAASIADGAIDTATFASGCTIPRVTLVDTVTTLTGHTAQTGDAFARIGATGSGLTTLATQASLDTVDDFLDTEIAAIKSKTDNLPGDPADASDITSSFSTVNSTLATIAAYIDTEVAAIKAKTDSLTFTVAGKVDANATHWLGTACATPGVAGVPEVDVTHALGTAVLNYDGTLASATATTITFPATDAAGNAVPDDTRYDYMEVFIVGGTGRGQTVQLTTRASTRTYTVEAGTMPVACGADSQYLVGGSWRSVEADLLGTLNDALASLADPLLNTVTGDYDEGTAGYAIGRSLQLLSAAGGTVTVGELHPADGGVTRLVQGDDYRAANGRNLAFTLETSTSLTGATAALSVYQNALESAGLDAMGAVSATPVSCTVAAITGGYSITCDLTRTQTAALALGAHRWELKVTFSSGNVWTASEGTFDVTI